VAALAEEEEVVVGKEEEPPAQSLTRRPGWGCTFHGIPVWEFRGMCGFGFA
jgi:hypothetical protein